MESETGHGRADPDTNVTDDDLVLTGRIAQAHLVEIPDYYTRLADRERSRVMRDRSTRSGVAGGLVELAKECAQRPVERGPLGA